MTSPDLNQEPRGNPRLEFEPKLPPLELYKLASIQIFQILVLTQKLPQNIIAHTLNCGFAQDRYHRKSKHHHKQTMRYHMLTRRATTHLKTR